jgi:hypothetical protein
MKPKDAQAAEEIDKLIGYLQRHETRVNDWFARKRGYPIGSGGANRRIRPSPMSDTSVPGRRETVTNANQMLALRYIPWHLRSTSYIFAI